MSMIVLAEGADRAAEIDIEEAKVAKERAEQALREKLEQKDYEKTRIELLCAVTRIQAAEKHRQK